MCTQAEKWDAIFSRQSCAEATAGQVLKENCHLLPASGAALDLACGLGGNAIMLAHYGLSVQAWDISRVAIEKLDQYARQKRLDITTKQCDVEKNPPGTRQFDVVVVSFFLYRPIMSAIIDSVKPGGLLLYQTFTREKVSQQGPTNPDYLLAKNELLSMCKGMGVLVYREEGQQGDVTRGWRNQAMVVARQNNN